MLDTTISGGPGNREKFTRKTKELCFTTTRVARLVFQVCDAMVKFLGEQDTSDPSKNASEPRINSVTNHLILVVSHFRWKRIRIRIERT